MNIFNTSDKNFDNDVLQSTKPVIVDFWAEWCGPCKQIAPILEAISIEKKDSLSVYKINIDENPEIPQKYGVRGIPTIMIFKDGRLIDQKVGSLPKSIINDWIESNLGV